MHSTQRHRLLAKLILVVGLTLSAFVLLLYILLQTAGDPRLLKRIFGYDSFAGFLLSNGGGILAALALGTLLVFVVRTLVFSKKLHGPVDALHRILQKLSAGELDASAADMAGIPDVIKADIAFLARSLTDRYATIESGLAELRDISLALRRMTIDSTLRVSFLNSQLDTLDARLDGMGQALADISLPRPDQLASVLIVGSGPSATALAANIRATRGAVRIWSCPKACDAPTEPAPFDLVPPFDAAVAFVREQSITLTIFTDQDLAASGFGEALTTAGQPVCGFGNRLVTLTRDPAYLTALLQRLHVPLLPAKTLAGADAARAFLVETTGPWSILQPDGCRGLADGTEDLVEALRELDSNPDFFSGDRPLHLIAEGEGQDYSALALADRFTIRVLSVAELALREQENDLGRPTRGLGAFAPAFAANDAIAGRIQRLVAGRIHAALRREGIVYRGFMTLRIRLRPDGTPLLRELQFGLVSPESSAILPGTGAALARLCLAAAGDSLRDEEIPLRTGGTIALVFHGIEDVPETPTGMRIAIYPGDDDRRFELVCSRPSAGETIHAAYLATLPLLGDLTCAYRRDVGGRTLLRAQLAKRKRRPLPGISGMRRLFEWLLRTYSAHKGGRL